MKITAEAHVPSTSSFDIFPVTYYFFVDVLLNDEFCTLQQLLVVPTFMQSSMCLPRLPNLRVVYSSKPRTPTLVTLQLPVPLFGCTFCSALCLQLATFCSVLCHSFFNQGGVISTCLGALFRPRWLRQPAGAGVY